MAAALDLDYKEPDWAGPPPDPTLVEIIKSGQILQQLVLKGKQFFVIGRLPVCDIELEHASISRYHAVIQFDKKSQGYIYDLGSVHGTKLNKRDIPVNTYIKLSPQDQLKFGASTRTLIYHTDQVSSEPKPSRVEMETKKEKAQVVMESEEATLYQKDPKNFLRDYLMNQGYEVKYEIEEDGPIIERTFTARVKLYVNDEQGAPLYGIASSSKKREAERMAALDACKKLDQLGLLGDGANQEDLLKARKFKQLLKQMDSDDEDNYLDRTIQNKKRKFSEKTETFESLMAKRTELQSQVDRLKKQIARLRLDLVETSTTDPPAEDGKEEEDELALYMKSLDNTVHSEKLAKWENELQSLQNEVKRYDKLVAFTKPDAMFSSSSTSPPPPPPPTLKDLPEIVSTPTVNNTTNTANAPKVTKEKTKSVKPSTKEVAAHIDEENYVEWLPPENQTGDGHTNLNEKYGY